RRGGQRRDTGRWIAKILLQPLERSKEEQLVFTIPNSRAAFSEFRQEHWTTNIPTAAKVIVARHELSTRNVSFTHEAFFDLSRVKRAQVAIAEEPVQRTVPVIRTCLGDGNELSAGCPRKLGGELVLYKRKLRHGFRRDIG